MKILSRSEELVLLAIWKLEHDAYCVPIRNRLIKITGKNWSFGSIYDPLERLEKNGLLDSFLTDPINERGGRRKRIYRLTPMGRKALLEIKSIHDAIWADVRGLKPETNKV